MTNPQEPDRTPPPYLVQEAARIETYRVRLAQAEANVPRMERNVDQARQQLMDMIRDLEAEKAVTTDLAHSVPFKVRSLELLCADGGWDVPKADPVQPPPEATETETRRFLGSAPVTQRSPIPRFAKPSEQRADGGHFCAQLGCGSELVHENGIWTHTVSGDAECEPVLSGQQEARPDIAPDTADARAA